MKCEVCQELLEEYLDGELSAGEQEQINAHLITCADCSENFSTLSAEQELFSRYDHELEVPPFLWTRIAQHTVAAEKAKKPGWWERLGSLFAAPSFVGAVTILLIAIAFGAVYFIKDPTLPRNGTDPTQVGAKASTTDPNQAGSKTLGTDPNADQHRNPNLTWTGSVPQRGSVGSISTPRRKVRPAVRAAIVQSDVLSSDLGYLGIEDRETAKHIEKTQNLLRSIRNFPVSDGDEEI